MKAAVYERYGPPEVMHIADVPTPTPAADEVLIKVRASTVSMGDYRARTLDTPKGFRLLSRLVFGVRKPRKATLGTELAGDVTAVGPNVTTFAVGDPVIAFTDASMGCHAEYRCVREDRVLVPKPPNVSYEQAAAMCFGGTTALHFLRKAKLQSGESVLINGASGAVGSACVQLARHFGAEVTAVCSGANADLVTSLGAQHVIDYTKEDFTQSDLKYDVIVDIVDSAPFPRSKHVLNDGGRLVLVSASLSALLKAPFRSLIGNKKVIGGVALGKREDVKLLAELVHSGVFTPVIDRVYPIDEIVEAHRYVASKRKKGSVVVTFEAS